MCNVFHIYRIGPGAYGMVTVLHSQMLTLALQISWVEQHAMYGDR
jgi:hypothetical protein